MSVSCSDETTGDMQQRVLDSPRFLIVGGDADGNLGDRAILLSMCRELRAVYPRAELTVVSSNPSEAAVTFGARAIRRGLPGLWRQARAARRSDVVLCGGGGLFQDDDSIVKMPYWALRLALLRLFCPRIVGVSLGVGPLRWPTSRWFARLAFACMESVSVRDPVAHRTAAPLTSKPVQVVPDPALLLSPAPEDEALRWLERHGVSLDGPPLVGVALRRWFPPRLRLVPNHVASRFRRRPVQSRESEQLTDLLAEALDAVVKRSGARVLFIPSYLVAHEGDDRVCEETLAKMTTPGGIVLHIRDPALFKSVLGHLRVMLGGRMHPALLAASVGTPVVGLAYNPKFHGLFELLDLKEYLLDIETFIAERQSEKLTDLLSRAITERPVTPVPASELAAPFRHLVAGLVPS